jgi:hypothetical protein
MPSVEEAGSKGCIGRQKTYVADNDSNIDSNNNSKTTQGETQAAKNALARRMRTTSFDIDYTNSALIRHEFRRIALFSATFQRRSTIAILHYAVTAENAASISTSGIVIRETQNGAGE